VQGLARSSRNYIENIGRGDWIRSTSAHGASVDKTRLRQGYGAPSQRPPAPKAELAIVGVWGRM